MSKEIELKLVALPEEVKSSLPLILNKLNAQDVKENWLTNTYFDTPDTLLNKYRIALRIRGKSGRFIQTLKTKGVSVAGVHQRGEWEWELTQNKLDGSLFAGAAWPKGVSVDSLIPFFETNFKRTSAIVECQGTKIELAVDDGYISSGGRKALLSEIELEIIEGDVDHLFDIAAVIAGSLPVMLADVSKAERGYRLGSGIQFSEFSYSYECEGDYKQYVKSLMVRNLSYWLFLFDRAGIECTKEVLKEMRGVLIVLKELASSYQYVDSGKGFSGTELFDVENERISQLLNSFSRGRIDLAGISTQLLSSLGSGVLAIELGRWLQKI